MFSSQKLRRVVKGVETVENMDFYYRLAEENNVDILFYSLHSLIPHSAKVKGYLYSYQKKRLLCKAVKIPKINLVRTVIKSRRIFLKLSHLENKYQLRFLNLSKERNKYHINKHLHAIPSISEYVPDTERLSYKGILSFLDKYPKVIIKPMDGAQGEKIVTLEKEESRLLVHFILHRKQHKKVISINKLSRIYKALFKNPKEYLIQQWINFRRYEGEKFDIRTSVQKDMNGEWKVTGIVSRVAGKNGIVTNIAQGGRAVPFRDINPFLKQKIEGEIRQASIDIASELEGLNKSTVDLGLDLGIDENDKLWFIEANYCDQRYAYRESNDLEMWQASYRTPFEYAYATYIKAE